MPDHPLDTFQARPGQTLWRHKQGVVAGAEALTAEAGSTPYDDDWATVLETLAWTHDAGKLTEYFQTYVETGTRSSAPYDELTYHGLVGALLAAYALHSRDCAPETVTAGFYAVMKHHSVLGNVRTDFREYFEQNKQAVDNRYEMVGKQLASIDETAAAAADTLLRKATDGALGWDAVPSDNPAKLRKSLERLESCVMDPAFYGCVLRSWSTLVAADKFDAGGLTTPASANGLTRPPRPPISKIDEEIRSLADTELPDGSLASTYLDAPDRFLPDASASTDQRLDALRTRANAQATRALSAGHADGLRVFRLTLPTGFGKTLTALRATLTLAERRDSRVVYALPYTSIIDQVDDRVQEIFGIEPGVPAYTKHHHLADTRTNPEELAIGDHVSSGRDILHAEAWRSGLILTTFTQLFESVAGPGNIQSMKLPALQDSVIVVDEPQAVSLDWWALIGRLTEYLTNEYDATVLFMTATQPKILDRLADVPTPTQLIEAHDVCLDLIKDSPRVAFRLHSSLQRHLEDDAAAPLPLGDAATELRDATTADTNTLAVVNTVESAAALTEQLSGDSVAHLADHLVAYRRANDASFDATAYLNALAARSDPSLLVATLTTRLRPMDRSALLTALRRILDDDTVTPFDDTPTIAVSTQLIEAGVDVSFDRLYRDFAPLPTIVQAAGRCNREFGAATSPVTIWRLGSPADDDYVPSRLIYGERSLLRPTRVALDTLRDADDGLLDEAAVVDCGVERYYEALHKQRRTGDRHDELAAAFDDAQGEILRQASLVEQTYPTRDVLVLVTDSDRRRYQRYEQHCEAEKWDDARSQFQRLKRLLVSIPTTDPDADADPDIIAPENIEERYDSVFGRGPADSPTDSSV